MKRLARFLGSLFQSPPWDEQVFWALDLETTGYDPKADQILSIGMVPIRRGVIRNGESFYSLVRPIDPSRLDTAAIRAHHILPSELEGAPRIGFLLPGIDRKLREGTLLLHFSHLDIGFLKRAYRGTAMPWPDPQVVDTVRLIMKASREERFTNHHPTPWPTSLAGAREKVGLPPHAWHHALADAVATAELFLALRSRLGARRLRELL